MKTLTASQVTAMRKPVSRHKKILTVLAVAAAFMSFLAYIPSLKNGFIDWDDNLYVHENPDIRIFSLSFLRRVFTSYTAYNWHPLTVISFAIEYRLIGLNPFVYHLTNVIFHALNTFLVAVLTFRLIEVAAPAWKEHGSTRALAASFVTALLFGLHPLHVESVAWVAERKDVLYSFFFLLSSLAYLEYVSSSAKKKYLRYAWALLFFAFSIMSKPMAVTLPAVFLLLDYYPLNRFTGFGKKIRDSGWLFLEKVPFFALSMLSAILTIQAQRSSIAPIAAAGFATRFFTAVHACIFYLYRMLIPVGLAPLYPYPEHVSFLSPEYLGSFILFAGISVTTLLVFRKHKILLSAWIYYLITLLPVIGIVQVGSQAAADRYTYLPSLGPFILAGAGISFFLEKPGAGLPVTASKTMRKTSAPLAVAAAGMFLAFISFSTLKQEVLWKDSMTLWNYELKKFPRAYAAYHNRGVIYMYLHDYKNAIDDLNKAIAINPNPSFLSYSARGLVYQMKGDDSLAVKDFRVVIALNPQFSKSHNDLGISYGNLKQYDNAIGEFNKAIELDPKFEEAYNNRGYTYLKMGEYEKAIKDIRNALELDPGKNSTYYNLAAAYSKAGDAKQAELYLKKASSLSGKAAK